MINSGERARVLLSEEGGSGDQIKKTHTVPSTPLCGKRAVTVQASSQARPASDEPGCPSAHPVLSACFIIPFSPARASRPPAKPVGGVSLPLRDEAECVSVLPRGRGGEEAIQGLEPHLCRRIQATVQGCLSSALLSAPKLTSHLPRILTGCLLSTGH